MYDKIHYNKKNNNNLKKKNTGVGCHSLLQGLMSNCLKYSRNTENTFDQKLKVWNKNYSSIFMHLWNTEKNKVENQSIEKLWVQ